MKLYPLLLVAGLLIVSGCSVVDGEADEGEENEEGLTTYELTVSVDPSEGGSVDPEDGTEPATFEWTRS